MEKNDKRDEESSGVDLFPAGHILVNGRMMQFWLPDGMTAEDVGVVVVFRDEREPLLSA